MSFLLQRCIKDFLKFFEIFLLSNRQVFKRQDALDQNLVYLVHVWML